MEPFRAWLLARALPPSTAEAVDVSGLQAWFTDLGQPDGGALFDVVVSDGEVTTLRFRYRP